MINQRSNGERYYSHVKGQSCSSSSQILQLAGNVNHEKRVLANRRIDAASPSMAGHCKCDTVTLLSILLEVHCGERLVCLGSSISRKTGGYMYSTAPRVAIPNPSPDPSGCASRAEPPHEQFSAAALRRDHVLCLGTRSISQ
jgi:hypothetical protein